MRQRLLTSPGKKRNGTLTTDKRICSTSSAGKRGENVHYDEEQRDINIWTPSSVFRSARLCPGMPRTFVDKVPLNTAVNSAFLSPDTASLTASERVFRRDRWYLDNLPLPCFCPTGCAGAARIPLCITTVVDVC